MALPSVEERHWLGRYLRKLIERMGWERFVCAPILLPSPKYFPDRWDGTVADIHRLTQRLMHHAGLGKLEFSLSGFEGASELWDAGTAGWFAGIEDGRAYFGVHADQLHDPESAVGVMAHEVAHAWRTHHHLVADRREREELLTDLTTIYLGFGVFTTNNTDRYRSSGDANETSWSVSWAGYLPPNAMAWALALQVAARGERGNASAIARELEPNQQGAFRNALREIENDRAWLEALGLPNTPAEPWTYELIAVREPDEEEIAELAEEEEPEPRRNAGILVYRLRKPDSIFDPAFIAIIPGIFVGILLYVLLVGQPESWHVVTAMGAGFVILWILLLVKAWRYVCNASDCGEPVTAEMAVCAGCGGTLGGTITARHLRKVREQELERRAEKDDYDDCAECQPELPCEKHKATMDFEEFAAMRD